MAKRIVRATKEQAVASFSWDQILAWRVEQHHLHRRSPAAKMLDVTGAVCGLQAQVLANTVLMLHARLEDITPGIVDQALWQQRSLVKSWAMRGTLHLLPARDYPMWQAAFSTYQHYLKGVWLRHFGFTREELEQVLAAICQALDGSMLTREELATEVARRVDSQALGEKLLDSWGATLKPASFRGCLCYAPDNEERNVRFTRPDRWLPAWREEDPQEAMRDVTRRYLSTYGPATRENFSRWWGVSPAQAMKQIRRLGEEVVVVQAGETPSWLLAEHVQAIQDTTPAGSVNLLPAFDPYILGAPRDEPSILPGEFKERVYRKQGWISPVLLVDGRIAGVWERKQKGNGVEIQIEPFDDLPEWVQRVARNEAERLSAFLSTSVG